MPPSENSPAANQESSSKIQSQIASSEQKFALQTKILFEHQIHNPLYKQIHPLPFFSKTVTHYLAEF